MSIKTRFLIVSDTYAGILDDRPKVEADVVIHCGNLTRASLLYEYQSSLRLLETLEAPLKLVIPGNRDLTLDKAMIKTIYGTHSDNSSEILLPEEYGEFGEARRLFDQCHNIRFLGEGMHTFGLSNGALLKVYASPYTPSVNVQGFTYHPQARHNFAMKRDVDVVITHGPPYGILDWHNDEDNTGCPQLLNTIARARPRLHCFGHNGESWGALLLAWKQKAPLGQCRYGEIDWENSVGIRDLADIKEESTDTREQKDEKKLLVEEYRRAGFYATRHCLGDQHHVVGANDRTRVVKGKNTLFLNATLLRSTDNSLPRIPWLVDIELPSRRRETGDQTCKS